VHEVCTTARTFAHFSLAPRAPIRDNPARSQNGSTRADKS